MEELTCGESSMMSKFCDWMNNVSVPFKGEQKKKQSLGMRFEFSGRHLPE